MNYNRVVVSSDEPLYVYPIGDLHIGHENCDLDFIEEYLESIPIDINSRIILMGDLMDCGTKDSIGASVYENDCSPQEQLDLLIKLFEPFKDQIDGCVMGNHEARIYKNTGIDVMKIFCDSLGIDYAKYSGVITYSIGKKAYNINYLHGKCGGSVENALRKVKDMSNKVVCDAYLMGHVHQTAYTSRQIKYVDSRNAKLTEATQHFVLTGHSLNYDDSYAEQANLEISTKSYPILKLFNNVKMIEILKYI